MDCQICSSHNLGEAPVGDLLKSFHALASFADSQFKTVDAHLTSSDFESAASIRSVALIHTRVTTEFQILVVIYK